METSGNKKQRRRTKTTIAKIFAAPQKQRRSIFLLSDKKPFDIVLNDKGAFYVGRYRADNTIQRRKVAGTDQVFVQMPVEGVTHASDSH